MTTGVKDGSSWPIGSYRDAAWLDTSLGPAGRLRRQWLPTAFDDYCELRLPDDPLDQPAYDRAVISALSGSGDAKWWLGYLEYGLGVDVVFNAAPRTRIFTWDYVLVQAGPEQALNWRPSKDRQVAWKGALPDLIFASDHSWVLFTPWDEARSFLGGPRELILRFERNPELSARISRTP